MGDLGTVLPAGHDGRDLTVTVFLQDGDADDLAAAARAAAAAARRKSGDLGRVGRCQPCREVTRLAGRGGVRLEVEVDAEVDAEVFERLCGVCSTAGKAVWLSLFVDLMVFGEGVLRSCSSAMVKSGVEV